MSLLIDLGKLEKVTSNASFQSHGDPLEREFGHLVSEHFPNCERFWCLFVVPLTRRMDDYPNRVGSDTRLRGSVSAAVADIASAHYSLFVHLAFAHLHIEKQTRSYLEDAYVHMAAACDLTESVLEKWYLLLLRCQGRGSRVASGLTLEEFLGKATEWYEQNYADWFDHYYSKGKAPPLRVLPGTHLLREYLGPQVWSDYVGVSQPIRQFRNAIVHDVIIGRIIEADGTARVPNPSEVSNYRSWGKVSAVAGRADIVAKDFVEPHSQARTDLSALEGAINRLWNTMLREIRDELLLPDRGALRKEFNLELSTAADDVPPVAEITPDFSQGVASGSEQLGSADTYRQYEQQPPDIP